MSRLVRVPRLSALWRQLQHTLRHTLHTLYITLYIARDILLDACTERSIVTVSSHFTTREQVCLLVFLNGVSWEGPVCPRIGESRVRWTMYGITGGRSNVTVVPCTTSGMVAVESAVSTAVVVHP